MSTFKHNANYVKYKSNNNIIIHVSLIFFLILVIITDRVKVFVF